MSRVWDMPQYQLSSAEDKSWATSKGYPKMDLMDIAKHTKIPTQKSIKVKTNTGEASVTVEPSMWRIEPVGLHKTKLKDGSYKTVWMVKGKTPTGKTAEWFTEKDLSDSQDVKDYAKELKDAQTKFFDDYFGKIAIDLEKRLSPTAKKALKDNLADLIYNKKFRELRKWFIDNNFIDVPEENEFKKMASLSGFTSTSGADSWGHTTGAAIGIDWKDKKFYTYGWSSDD